LGVVTFEPHPRVYFNPDIPPFRLMSRAARASRLQKLGVERLYELPFNAGLAGLSPEEFAARVIRDGLGLRHVVVGADFCFGHKRAGTAASLVEFGAEMGFGVTIAPLLERGTATVSSTAIRDALRAGQTREAAAMLGHWHRIEGPVIGGEQRGRELGYPTANMTCTPRLLGFMPFWSMSWKDRIRANITASPHWACARCLAKTVPIWKPSSLIFRAIYMAHNCLSR
jgi:riboflavin kinase/FMN adenylyltransferase